MSELINLLELKLALPCKFWSLYHFGEPYRRYYIHFLNRDDVKGYHKALILDPSRKKTITNDKYRVFENDNAVYLEFMERTFCVFVLFTPDNDDYWEMQLKDVNNEDFIVVPGTGSPPFRS